MIFRPNFPYVYILCVYIYILHHQEKGHKNMLETQISSKWVFRSINHND